MPHVLIIGGTSGTGRALAVSLLRRGYRVTIAGRDANRANRVAQEILADDLPTGSHIVGIGVDLSQPATIATAVQDLGPLGHVVLAGLVRDRNSIADYDIARATELVTVKIVGYTTAVHALRSQIEPDGSILLFGGISKDVPYPGSTTMTAVNTAVLGLVTTLAVELAPIRVNAIHPGLIGDSPFWAGNVAVLEAAQHRTLAKRLPTMDDIVGGCRFLLENPAANGINLSLDGGRA
jgi:NAD(P)-dependent dehydrogenase (short-subunit alcohol dehydrogenase family)